MTQSIESNPYKPPVGILDVPAAHPRRERSSFVRALVAVQALVIVVALVLESRQHESIVGSGPVFALVGLVIAMVAWRQQDRLAIVYGFSASAFALLIVFLINFNGWGPPQGDRPISVLAYCYSMAALPVTCWLLRR